MTDTVVADQGPATGGGEAITPEQFEAEARALPRRQRREASGGDLRVGPGLRQRGPVPRAHARAGGRDDLAAARAWAQTVFDAGFGWITGPPEYGGRGLPREYQRIYAGVAAEYRTPSPLGLRDRPGHGGADHPGPRHRRGEGGLPAPDVPGRHRRPASCSASRRRAPTWPHCRPGRSATATSGSSTARRCGRRGPRCPTSARSSAAPTPTCPSTAG